MTVGFCPNCNQRYVISFDTIDFVHECNSGNDAIDQEDVFVIGDWVDYTGSDSIAPQEVLRQGAHNELQGRRAGIQGADKEDLTRRGRRASTHRQRQRLFFINFKEERLY